MSSSSKSEELQNVLRFLRRHGFRQAENALTSEIKKTGLEQKLIEIYYENNGSLSSVVLDCSIPNNNSDETLESRFREYLNWVHNSLDSFREELSYTLYPIFVHSFLDLMGKNLSGEGTTLSYSHVAHRFLDEFQSVFEKDYHDDLNKLKGIHDANQLKDNQLTALLKSSRFDLDLSPYSFQLMLTHLQEHKLFLFLKIINQYTKVRIVSSLKSQDHWAKSSPTPKIEWGVNFVDPQIEAEVFKNLRSDVGKSSMKTSEQINVGIQNYRKLFIESQKNVPAVDSDKIPLLDIPDEIIEEETKKIKELSLKAAATSKSISSSCFTLHNYGQSSTSVGFSPNFDYLCVGTSNSHIDIWSCSGNTLRTLKPSTELAALDLNQIKSMDDIFENGDGFMKRLIGHSGAISAVKMNRNSSAVLSASFDCSVRLWSSITFSCLSSYKSHAFPVWDADLSPLGHYFVSASADRTCRVWNLDYSYPVRVYGGHLSDVDSVKFHPNGCYFASGSSDKTCRLWDVYTGDCVRLFRGHSKPISALSFSKSGKLMAAGDFSGNVHVYDIGEGKLLWKTDFDATPRSVLSLDFSYDDRILSVSFSDCSLNSFYTEDFNRKPVDFYTKQTPIYCLNYSPRDVLMCAGPFCPA